MILVDKKDEKIEESNKQEASYENNLSPMNAELVDIMKGLSQKEVDNASYVEELEKYLRKYDRILYSVISNVVYTIYEKSHNKSDSKSNEKIGNIHTNLEKMYSYSISSNYQQLKRETAEGQEDLKDLSETIPKILIKIIDHVTLAEQQYNILKENDEQYKKRFEQNIGEKEKEITRDMSTQLVTLVGIFTAVAFVVFGGISSLDNIFSHGMNNFPVMKLSIIGIIWGISMINLIYVFLFCVGKITKLSIKSSDKPNDNLVQKYPIIWWSNFMLIGLLAIFSWIYYLETHSLTKWFNDFCLKHSMIISIVGFVMIIIILIYVGTKLIKERNNKQS